MNVIGDWSLAHRHELHIRWISHTQKAIQGMFDSPHRRKKQAWRLFPRWIMCSGIFGTTRRGRLGIICPP